MIIIGVNNVLDYSRLVRGVIFWLGFCKGILKVLVIIFVVFVIVGLRGIDLLFMLFNWLI